MKWLACFFLIFTVPKVFACSCSEWTSAREMYNSYEAVYLAIPQSNSRSAGRTVDGETPLLTTFSVTRDYKKAGVKQVTLGSWKETGGNCGAEFKKDEGLYLIFAYKDEAGKMRMNGCTISSVEAYPETMKLIRDLNKI